MNARNPNRWVSAAFAAILISPGLIQIGIELSRAETPQALDLFTRKPTVARLRAYEDRLEDASWVAARLRPWVQAARFVCLGDPGPKALLGRKGWWFYQPGVEYATQRAPAPGPSGDPVLAISKYHAQLAERGMHLLVVVAPNKSSVYPENVSRRGEHVPEAISPTTRSVLERLRAAGVEVVDLFALYHRSKPASSGGPTDPLYLAQDSHWSPAGLELAARVVARRLLERGWIKLGNTTYDRRPLSLQRRGDIVTMLGSRPLERRWAPELVVCTQIVDSEAGEIYRDDPAAEVLVLGDSFLRIFQQDDPGGAGFLAHLALELMQPVASVVNDGGASALVRQELYRRPALLENKKVVIWEFVERDIRYGTEGWPTVPLP